MISKCDALIKLTFCGSCFDFTQAALQASMSACAVNTTAVPGQLIQQDTAAYNRAQTAFARAVSLARCITGATVTVADAQTLSIAEGRALGNLASVHMRLAQLDAATEDKSNSNGSSTEARYTMAAAVHEFECAARIFRSLGDTDRQSKVSSD